MKELNRNGFRNGTDCKSAPAWERGANENTNGLIRQYFKKGTSFENLTDKGIERVQNILNTKKKTRILNTH